MLQIGDHAPDFILPSSPEEEISLYHFKGKLVLLVFYPADWSPVCGYQLALYSEPSAFFEHANLQLLAISVDGKWCHATYREQRNLSFPLLADFEPKGNVARKYGVYNEQSGESERALFLIDKESVINWRFLADPNVIPGLDGIMEAIERLNSQKLNAQ